MFESIRTKLRSVLCFSLIFLSFLSCQKNDSDELKAFNSFLETNYTFNTIVLNRSKAEYFQKRKEMPQINNEHLNNLEPTYEALLLKIDNAIISKESNIDILVEEYNHFFVGLKSFLAKFYDRQLDSYTTTTHNLNLSNAYRLKAMKNSLVLSMNYTYKSFTGNLFSTCGFSPIRVKTVVDLNENQAKIILKSNFIQTIEEEKDITIDKIVLNGIEKKVTYNITQSHDFTDIILDSLKPGMYEIEGSVQFFDRNGKIDISFREAFEIQ